jgi:hypothetical protein
MGDPLGSKEALGTLLWPSEAILQPRVSFLVDFGTLRVTF